MSDRRHSTWRATARVARYRSGLLSLSMVQLIAWNSATLLTGWLLQQLFDSLSGAAPAGLGSYEIIAVLAAAEVARIAVIWGGVIRTRWFEQLRGLLRLNLLRAQMQSGGPEAGTSATSTGEAVSRFRDDVEDFLGLISSLAQAVGKVVFAVGSIAIMLSIAPVIGLAVVLPLVAVVVVTELASGQIRTHRRAYRQDSAAVTGLLGEMFGSVLAVKSSHAGDGIVDHLVRMNDRRRRSGLRDQLVAQVLSKFNRATVDLSVGLVLLLAIPPMQQGDFTVGDLALFVTYVSSLVWVPHYVGQVLARHRQAGVAVERLATLLPPMRPDALVVHRPLDESESPPRIGSRDRTALESFTVCGLTAVHPASGRGVHDVSLSVKRGSFTVVTGPAGAGKTTLLRAVLGLLPTQTGTLWWNDAVVDDWAEFLVPPRSAYVPQVPRLSSESLQDNLLLGHEDTSRLLPAVHAAVLDRDVASMPEGLLTQVGARGVRLSGGQVQRAAIARALVRPADVLVLDDVSSALDVETESRLWDRLLADNGRTLLVVSNRPATIARADQVIRLEQGRVEAEASQLVGPACHEMA
jgi:ATP-binding cassette, subfamily B, bacterial